MSDLIDIDYHQAFRVTLKRVDGLWANIADEALEAYDGGNWADYLLTPTQVGTSSTWEVQIPSWLAAGEYILKAYAGEEPIAGDVAFGGCQFGWNADGLITAYSLQSAGLAEAVDEVLTAAGLTPGRGARSVVITVKDNLDNLVAAAQVRVTLGADTHTQITNGSGVVTFNLDDGTWDVTITRSGYTFGGASLVVAGNEAEEYTVTRQVIAPAADAAQATGYLTTRDGQGTIEQDVTLIFQLVDPAAEVDSWKCRNFTADSDDNGLLQIALKKGATYRAKRGNGQFVEFEVPTDTDTFELPAVLGEPGS